MNTYIYRPYIQGPGTHMLTVATDRQSAVVNIVRNLKHYFPDDVAKFKPEALTSMVNGQTSILLMNDTAVILPPDSTVSIGV